MNVKIQLENSFEKDLKKIKRRGKDLSKLKAVAEFLEAEIPLPERFRNHKLLGNYKDHWECHIEPDWLLIYKKTPTALIFIRTGTHADLF